jgi:hypothetical protein
VCADPNAITCTQRVWTTLAYLNYQFSPMDNLSFRGEFYNDMEAQRTAAVSGTRILDFAVGWQHWLSPQVELRPEIAFYRSLDAPVFNGNPYLGILPNRSYAVIGATDLIWHF